MVTFGVEHISYAPEPLLSALHTVALQSTITGNNASNETKLFALECYVVLTVPCVAACAVILLLLFCSLSDLRAQLEKCALRAAGTTRGDACIVITSFETCLKILPRIGDALSAFDDVCNSACF